jgi:hypothetical protein
LSKQGSLPAVSISLLTLRTLIDSIVDQQPHNFYPHHFSNRPRKNHSSLALTEFSPVSRHSPSAWSGVPYRRPSPSGQSTRGISRPRRDTPAGVRPLAFLDFGGLRAEGDMRGLLQGAAVVALLAGRRVCLLQPVLFYGAARLSTVTKSTEKTGCSRLMMRARMLRNQRSKVGSLCRRQRDLLYEGRNLIGPRALLCPRLPHPLILWMGSSPDLTLRQLRLRLAPLDLARSTPLCPANPHQHHHRSQHRHPACGAS